MPSSQFVAASALAAAGVFAAFRLMTFLRRKTHLVDLPGPPSPSWLLGHVTVVLRDDDQQLHQEWVETYGTVLRYLALFGRPILVVTDLRALTHILTRATVFPKPEDTRNALRELLGEGLLVAEGAAHRAQRRLLNKSAFAPNHVRNLSGVLLCKANELHDVWQAAIGAESEPAVVDAFSGISRATLDMIALAGLGYNTAALSRAPDDPSELSAAFAEMFSVGKEMSALTIATSLLTHFLPFLPTSEKRRVKDGRAVMNRIGRQLLSERKADVAAGKTSDSSRDLLSIMVNANIAEDVGQQLSDEDLLAQIPTLLIAGHETTASGTTWTLFALAQRIDVQARLREELRSLPLPTSSDLSSNAPLDGETLDQLDQLPLLDAVVRETLRLHPPVIGTARAAMCDNAIPVSTPYVDRNGVTRDFVNVVKDDTIFVPIVLVNRSKEIWGEDAHDWNPDRWLDVPPSNSTAIPAVWGNVFTFLSGPRSCIGFRFAILEMKLLLHALVTALTFELDVPANEIQKKTLVVTRPYVRGDSHNGPRLPLRVAVAKPIQ